MKKILIGLLILPFALIILGIVLGGGWYIIRYQQSSEQNKKVADAQFLELSYMVNHNPKTYQQIIDKYEKALLLDPSYFEAYLYKSELEAKDNNCAQSWIDLHKANDTFKKKLKFDRKSLTMRRATSYLKRTVDVQSEFLENCQGKLSEKEKKELIKPSIQDAKV